MSLSDSILRCLGRVHRSRFFGLKETSSRKECSPLRNTWHHSLRVEALEDRRLLSIATDIGLPDPGETESGSAEVGPSEYGGDYPTEKSAPAEKESETFSHNMRVVVRNEDGDTFGGAIMVPDESAVPGDPADLLTQNEIVYQPLKSVVAGVSITAAECEDGVLDLNSDTAFLFSGYSDTGEMVLNVTPGQYLVKAETTAVFTLDDEVIDTGVSVQASRYIPTTWPSHDEYGYFTIDTITYEELLNGNQGWRIVKRYVYTVCDYSYTDVSEMDQGDSYDTVALLLLTKPSNLLAMEATDNKVTVTDGFDLQQGVQDATNQWLLKSTIAQLTSLGVGWAVSDGTDDILNEIAPSIAGSVAANTIVTQSTWGVNDIVGEAFHIGLGAVLKFEFGPVGTALALGYSYLTDVAPLAIAVGAFTAEIELSQVDDLEISTVDNPQNETKDIYIVNRGSPIMLMSRGSYPKEPGVPTFPELYVEDEEYNRSVNRNQAITLSDIDNAWFETRLENDINGIPRDMFPSLEWKSGEVAAVEAVTPLEDLVMGSNILGELTAATPYVCYAYNLQAGDILTVKLNTDNWENWLYPLDPALAIFAPDQSPQFITSQDDTDLFYRYSWETNIPFGLNDDDPRQMEVVITESGTYTIQVQADPNATGGAAEGPFELDVTVEHRSPTPQMFFLDFSEFSVSDVTSHFDYLEGDSTTNYDTIINAAVSRFNGIFAPYQAYGLTTAPSGDYSEISFVEHINPFATTPLGSTDQVDYGNTDHTDTAEVFFDHFGLNGYEFDTPEQVGIAMGTVAAHEAGHLLGLFHVNALQPERDLMGILPDLPYLLSDEVLFGNYDLYESDKSLFGIDIDNRFDIFGKQDGDAILKTTVGVPPFQYVTSSYDTADGNLSKCIAADLDGDGYLDILTQMSGGWQGLYNQSGSGFSTGNYWGLSACPPADIVSVDLNDDGRSDLIFSSNDRIITLQSAGIDSWSNKQEYIDLEGNSFSNLAVGDFNNDGRQDVVASTGTGLQLFYSQPEGILTWGPYCEANDDIGKIAAGDIDGDGFPDIAAIQNTAVSVFFGNSEGELVWQYEHELGAPIGLKDIQVADLNGDGCSDVVASYKHEFAEQSEFGSVFVVRSQLHLLFGNNNRTLSGDQPPYSWVEGSILGYTRDFPIANIAIGNLNGDNLPDIALSTEGQNGEIEARIKILHQTSDGTFADVLDIRNMSSSGHTYGMCIGDFNRDQARDLAVAVRTIPNLSTPTPDKVHVFYGQVPQPNTPPQAVDDLLSTLIDSSLVIDKSDLLVNDIEPDQETLTLSAFTQPEYGTIADNGDGTITYSPPANFEGIDRFTYSIIDERGGTSTGNVQVYVNQPIPDPMWHHLQQSLMCESMQADDPWNPINPKTTFYQTDARVTWWAEFVNLEQAFTFSNRWYLPGGQLGFEWDTTIPEPETYWSSFKSENWQYIAGTAVAEYCGQWRVEVSAVNPDTNQQEVFDTKYFTILEDPAVAPTISVSSIDDLLYVSASDNTLLENVTVDWNDGSDHSRTWDDIFSPSFGGSITLAGTPVGTTVSYTVTAADTSGNTQVYSDSVTISVGEVNHAPILAAIGNQSVNEEGVLSFTVSATDPDDTPANAITVSATGLPTGAVFNPSTGVFTWTPTELQQGTYSVTFTATDDGTPSLSDSETITITVGEVNDAPILASIGNKTVDEQTMLSFTIAATDPNDSPANTITLSATGVPSGAVFNPATGVFTWTPTELQQGTYTVTFTATDNGSPNLTDTETLTITVNEVNDAPVLAAIGNQSVAEEDTLTFTVTASDANDDPANTVTLSATGLPTGATFNANTGVFSWTPTEAQQGSYTVTFTARDNGSPNLTDTETITITVNEVNDAPVITPIDNISVIEGQTAFFTVTASDPDDTPANSITLSATGLPTGATFNANTGEFYWTPLESQDGIYTVTFTATDNGSPNLTDTETVTITVGEANGAPVLDPIGNKSVSEEGTLTFTVTASDPIDDPADAITLSATGLPTGAVFNPATGVFTWTPTELQQGTYSVTFTATDDGTPSLSDSETITITVNNAPSAQIVSISPNPAEPSSQMVYFEGSGTDTDGTVVAWEWYSDLDGVLSTSENFSRPASSLTVGEYPIFFRVQDNEGAWSEPAAVLFHVDDATPVAHIRDLSEFVVQTDVSMPHLELDGRDNDENESGVVAGELYLDGVLVATPVPGSNHDDLQTPASPGNYTLEYRVQDDEGTWSPMASTTLHVVELYTPIILGVCDDTGNPNDGVTTDRTLTIHGAASPGTMIIVCRDGSEIGATRTSESGDDWTFDYTGTILDDGEYQFTAVAGDSFQHWSRESEPYRVVVDPIKQLDVRWELDDGSAAADVEAGQTVYLVVEQVQNIGLFEEMTLYAKIIEGGTSGFGEQMSDVPISYDVQRSSALQSDIWRTPWEAAWIKDTWDEASSDCDPEYYIRLNVSGDSSDLLTVRDTTPPTIPSDLHNPESPTTDTTPNVTWDASTDEASGVEKYEIVFHDSEWNFVDTPRFVFESTDTFLDDSEFSEPLDAKEWHWYVRAQDVAGNIGAWAPTDGTGQTIIVGLLPNLIPFQPVGWDDKIVVSTNEGDYVSTDIPIFSDQDIYIDWAVGNGGDAATMVDYVARLYVDDEYLDFPCPAPQDAGYWTGRVDCRVEDLTPGQHTIEIRVDATNVIDEISESDNIYSRTIDVRLRGDFDDDIQVGSADLDVVRAHWGNMVEPYTNGDANGDGKVGSSDLDIVRANWGTGTPTAAAAQTDSEGSIPVSSPVLIGPRRAPASDAALSSWGNSDPDRGLSDSDLASLAEAAWLREIESLRKKEKTRDIERIALSEMAFLQE